MRNPVTIWRICLCLLAFVLAGCATRPLLVSEAEVRARHGEPTRVWPNPDGSRTLEYATQPFGETCWMYTIAADGRVVAQFDALAPENLARVEIGMSLDEVTRLLGEARSVQRFPRLSEEVWDWNIPRDAPDLIATRFNVHFVEGRVVRTSRSHEYRSEAWSSGFGFGLGIGIGRGVWPWGPEFGVVGPRWPHRPHRALPARLDSPAETP